MRAVGPLVGLVHEALHEGLSVGVDGLGHVQEVILLWVDEGVEAMVQEATVRDWGDRPPEEVVVSRHLWASGGEGGGGHVQSFGWAVPASFSSLVCVPVGSKKRLETRHSSTAPTKKQKPYISCPLELHNTASLCFRSGQTRMAHVLITMVGVRPIGNGTT